MEYDLRERIEELQKCRAEITAIQSRIKNEKEDFWEYVASERKALEETIARERIALETTLEARKENKKRELAEKLNCSREFISRVENLKEKVSLKMLLKLSELFSVNPKYFFDED